MNCANAKGSHHERPRSLLRNRNYYASMMVKMGEADVMLSGLAQEYPEVLRPALQIFGTRPNVKHASGVYIMVVNGRTLVFTDATVNIDPDSETLAEIAILASDFAKTLDVEPRVAMLSFSNFGATPHPLSEKIRRAVEIVRERRQDIVIDGEMQADTAVVAEIIEDRYPFSQVKDANVLVFPQFGLGRILRISCSTTSPMRRQLVRFSWGWAHRFMCCKQVKMLRILLLLPPFLWWMHRVVLVVAISDLGDFLTPFQP